MNSSVLTGFARFPATMPTIPSSSNVAGQEYRVNYLPAESDTGMFGGNSNWRGPIWMPVNAVLIRALLSVSTSITETTSKSSVPPAQAN